MEYTINYAGDSDSIPGLGRSPGEGNGNPLQYFCLENPMGRATWQATVHGVAKSWASLSNWAHRSTQEIRKNYPMKFGVESTHTQAHTYSQVHVYTNTYVHWIMGKKYFLLWREVKSLSQVWLFVTLWTVAHQAPLSMGFSKQEYWSRSPFPSPSYCELLSKKVWKPMH